jgi:hypothetical protein
VNTWFPPCALGNAHRLAVRRLFESCNGLVTLAVLTAEIARQPLTGDHVNDTLAAAATLLLRQIAGRSLADAAPCAFCTRPLWREESPGAIGVMLPFGLGADSDAIGVLICVSCATDRSQAELVRAVLNRLPGARALPPPVNGVGHA